MGRHESTRVDEGRKRLGLLAIKMQGTNRSGEGGEEPVLCVSPDLSSMERERRKGEDSKWDEKN